MDFIQIGGKERPVKYGWNAIREFTKNGNDLGTLYSYSEDGKSLEVNIQSIGILLDLIYVGLKNGARIEKTRIDFTIEDVGDWMDDEGIEKMNEFVTLFVDQIPKQKKV